ncbi:aminopeptidase P N-terminal domain-containing protein [candidate division KSB1 bacterium]|nr:aminopeptidase P N-terminal domain-containing protein [candidate division KSB1 bacterium]
MLRILTWFVLSLSWLRVEAGAGEKFSGKIDAVEYQARRNQVLTQMDPHAVAVFRAASTRLRSNDVNYPYRQESNFLYLTGYEQPGAFLILVPAGFSISGRMVREILLIPATADSITGFEAVVRANQFETLLKQVLVSKEVLYYTIPPPSFYYEPIIGKRYFFENDLRKELGQKFSGVKLQGSVSLLSGLREIKSPAEIQRLQMAIDITCAGLREAFRSAEPGLYEYELQAILEYLYLRNGATGPGFPCIIGSGPNSLILHYDENRRQMQAGDVLVLDVGAEYQGYTADITRTIPVNGKFSPAQSQLYEIVLSAQREALKLFKPGSTSHAIEEKVRQITAQGLIRLGLMQDAGELRTFLPHGVSHFIGLDVHDGSPLKELRPGMVLTLEPGVYIPANRPAIPRQYWNIGIRIEDDILITETGAQVLSDKVPKEIAEIEQAMRAKGLGNQDFRK